MLAEAQGQGVKPREFFQRPPVVNQHSHYETSRPGPFRLAQNPLQRRGGPHHIHVYLGAQRLWRACPGDIKLRATEVLGTCKSNLESPDDILKSRVMHSSHRHQYAPRLCRRSVWPSRVKTANSLTFESSETQCKTLGMDVQVFDAAGTNIEHIGVAGELVCNLAQYGLHDLSHVGDSAPPSDAAAVPMGR